MMIISLTAIGDFAITF